MVARRSAMNERIVTLDQLRHVCFTAEAPIRRRFEGLSIAQLVKTAAALEPRPSEDSVRHATLVAIRTLARRVVYLREEVAEVTVLLKPLVETTAPGLLSVYGVGYEVAAKLLIAAGDNPERLTLRSSVRAPVRRRHAASLHRQDHPAPTQPWREPPSEPTRSTGS